MKSATKSRKTKYHHGDLRRVLIDEAARLASREGIESVALRRVAAAASVSAAATYHHFRNKADLLYEVAEEGFRRLDAAMVRAAKRAGDDSWERLQAMGRAYIRFAARNPHYFKVMFRPELARSPEPDPDSAGQRSFLRLIGHVQEWMGEEGHPSSEVMEEMMYLWSTAHGLASLWVDGALSRQEPFRSWGIARLAQIVTERARRPRGG